MSFGANLYQNRRFYVESQGVARYPWPVAFRKCREDLDYVSKHSVAYSERNSIIMVLLFLVVAFAIAGAIGVGIYCLGASSLAAFICGFLIFVLLWVARWIGYQRVGMKIFMAKECIAIYSAKWPEIIQLVRSTPKGRVPSVPEYSFSPSQPDINFYNEENRKRDYEKEFGAEAVQVVDEMIAEMMEDAILRIDAKNKAEEASKKVSEPKSELKLGVQQSPEPKTEPEPKRKPEPEQKPEPKRKPEPEQKSEPKNRPRVEPKPKSESKPKSKPKQQEPKPRNEMLAEMPVPPKMVDDTFDRVLTEALLQIEIAKRDLAEIETKFQTLGL